jgi:hypothetical protein
MSMVNVCEGIGEVGGAAASEDTIEKALVELNWANVVLGDLVNKYSFYAAPDPEKALAYRAMVSDKEKNLEEKQSFQWYYDYNAIISFLQIAYDYTLKAQETLNKAIK